MKKLAVLVAALMVFSVAGFSLASAFPSSVGSTAGQVAPGSNPDFIKLHATGLNWVPPEEYEKITGFKLPYMNSEVFKQAIENAPSYSQERAKLVAKLKTVLGSAKTNINVADSYLLPKAAVNTLYLPPIGDQGWVGSCRVPRITFGLT